MRITVTAGHNVYVNGLFDPGAVKNPHVEADITKETVAILIPLLQSQGHEVLDATPYNQKFTGSTNTIARKSHHKHRCKKVDEFKSDIYLDVHINSGGGTGVECWVYSQHSKAMAFAKKICENISKDMNLPNRGVKVNPEYWSVSLCKSPAIIIEGSFIDNTSDMEKLTPEKYAISIAKCFGEVKIQDKVNDKKPSNNTLYKVQVGAYENKDNAESLVKELEKSGFHGFISKHTIQQKNKDTGDTIEIPKIKEKPNKGGETELTYKELIKKGSKGEHVKEFQVVLNKLGYNCGTPDGIAGVKTETAIKNFQYSNGLSIDGMAGKNTFNKINELLKNPSKNQPNTIPSSTPENYRKIRKFSSDVYVYIADKTCFVDVDLGVRGKLERTSSIVKNHLKAGKKVLAATNCGFFNWSGKPEHLGMLIDEGLYYSQPSKNFIDFIYYKNGTTEIKNLHGYNKEILVNFQKNSHWAIGTSYSLIQKGKINLENSEKFDHSTSRQPRTLLGQKKDGTFILVVVDGRRASSLGVTAKQSAEIMQELGCYNAVNLDGGGSSTMVIVKNGTPVVVNTPSDRGVERAVGSCLLVLQK